MKGGNQSLISLTIKQFIQAFVDSEASRSSMAELDTKQQPETTQVTEENLKYLDFVQIAALQVLNLKYLDFVQISS
ncbi:hypothetical protein ACHQM5_007378 [Ranunculus cassubicifolius]